MTDTFLPPKDLTPVHGIKRPWRVEELAAAMRRGWQGRPVLAMRLPHGGCLALTGTHRIAAASAAGLDQIPVRLLDSAEAAAVDPALWWTAPTTLRAAGFEDVAKFMEQR